MRFARNDLLHSTAGLGTETSWSTVKQTHTHRCAWHCSSCINAIHPSTCRCAPCGADPGEPPS